MFQLVAGSSYPSVKLGGARNNVFEFLAMWSVAGLLLPSPQQFSGDRSCAQSSLLTPMVTAATSVLLAEMEHSCSEQVKDEKAPITASPGLSAGIPELLPQSSKGGRGQGLGCAEKPWVHELGQGELRAVLSPPWEQQGREGSQYFQSWLLCFITAAFSRLVWWEEL